MCIFNRTQRRKPLPNPGNGNSISMIDPLAEDIKLITYTNEMITEIIESVIDCEAKGKIKNPVVQKYLDMC